MRLLRKRSEFLGVSPNGFQRVSALSAAEAPVQKVNAGVHFAPFSCLRGLSASSAFIFIKVIYNRKHCRKYF
ncbi:MAG: hypothetical protein KH284_04340 [Clostridiales bacterium]|nr:hypothetical protein [Clostridiales bacterium]